MFLEFDDLLVRGEKQELFKRCFNRCYAAVNVSYEYEKAKAGSFWNFDERYHEQGIEIGAVAELVGIEGGVVSGVINLESSGVEAPDWRPRHDEPYHEA